MQRSTTVNHHTTGHRADKHAVRAWPEQRLRLKPLVQAVALALLAGGGADVVHAQRAFSGAWFANKGAVQNQAVQTGRLPNGVLASSLTSPAGQQQQANEQLARSISNLNLAARGIAAQQAAQAAARAAAGQLASTVPDGLGEGGLKVDTNSLTAGWLNANGPAQTLVDGRTQVVIAQTADKAILNWETFNVGKNTTVEFQQQKDWAVLNRVNDPLARPSEIRGQIKAEGTVLLVNRNGILFSGTSQVNTRSLAAAAVGMTDAQFKKGIYSETQGAAFVPSFANDLATTASSFSHGAATAGVTVEAGARIDTHQPQSVTEGGGYVLLAGREVRNAGQITTASGQTVLAAGDSFVIRKGVGTDANQQSSTRGNEVTPLYSAGAGAGQVRNTGLIQSSLGDVTLTGRSVTQAGVVLGSTSVNTRGTVHLTASGAPDAQVSLAPGSLTAVLLDESGATALDVQRAALVKDSANASAGLYNRRDQSLVEIRSGGDVDFEDASLTLATGGQIAVDAVRRTQVASGAVLDVSGAAGVRVAMEANNVLVNVQGNEQRDAPVNRDDKSLNNGNIWVDRRSLVLVPAGTNGYETDRWYTAGGLLEVSGYLNTGGHGVQEWAASGGAVIFTGGEVVTRAGSVINVAGGSLDVATGYVNQTWLKGADGRLYNATNAPGDLLYKGLYKGFEQTHQRWGASTTEYFYNPLIAPVRRLEDGYTVGRDAGRVVVGTRGAVLEGQIDSTVYQGVRQQRARDSGLDGYQQAQTAAAQAGQLIIGQQKPVYDSVTGQLRYGPVAIVDEVSLGDAPVGGLPQAGRITLDADWLNAQRLGALAVYAKGSITVDEAVGLVDGGAIALHASDVAIHANLTARGGSISLGDILLQHGSSGDPWQANPIGDPNDTRYERQVEVAENVTLDARGVWTNRQQDAGAGGQPFANGGSVSVRSSGSVTLGAGSLIDVSSGAVLGAGGKFSGGKGGNVTLAAGQAAGAGVLALDGSIRGQGVNGGGTLNIEHGTMISIGGDLPQAVEQLAAGEVSALPLRLAADVLLQPGQLIPVSFTVVVTQVRGGQAMPVRVRPSVSATSPVVLQAPWLLPVTVGPATGPYQYAGTVLPAGTELHIISELPQGYVLPADVFPSGLPIPAQTSHYTAGSVTPTALVVPRGTRIPAGTAWQQDVAVQSFLALDKNLFQSGFKNYQISGRDGVVVVGGTQLDVRMPVLRVDTAAARELASGQDPSGALSVWLPPLQQEDPANREVVLREGASLSLTAGTPQAAGQILTGAGSRVTVDPGQSITLTSNGQITLEGTLQAHGGRISALPGQLGTGSELNRPAGMPNARSVWIGEGALLDVSGLAFTAVDVNGQRYGQVQDGGVIELGAAHDLNSRNLNAMDAFLVVRQGARLDASGATAELDLPGLGLTTLAGDGGVIALSGSNGLFIDGQLRAAAGGAHASGGTLALNLETPVYGPVERFGFKGPLVDDAVRVPRELVIEQVYSGSGLAAGVQAGQQDASLVYGKARYGVDAIHAGGFDTASLYVNGLLSFDGTVDLRMKQALYLTASSLNLASTAARDAQVNLAAPYLRLSGPSRRQLDNTLMPNPVTGSNNGSPAAGALGVPLLAQEASLTLAGSMVDVIGITGMGTRGTIERNAATRLEVEREAFGTVRIDSRGDLRLQAADFFSPGNTTLAAAQIYGSGNVTVGMVSAPTSWGGMAQSFDTRRVLNIERTGTALPAMPYSVFGALSFGAATINQGGVLRAPLGSITLGRADGSGYTGVVNLLPGSLTSVSANGLVMPYGGTVDGLVYNYNGVDVVYQGIGAEPKVEFRTHAVNAQPGAVIDLSGGGELTGAAFLQGRGGSTDARLSPLVQVRSDGRGFTLPSLSSNPVYAIVPGVQVDSAPVGAEKGAGAPAAGRQITIGEGVPGLAAGVYTLLPSNYALLPGAFRVELNGLAAGSSPFGGVSAMRNGSWSTAARLGTVNTGVRDVLATHVILTPADTLRTYSQFNETSYADFALQQAAREGIPRPLLERDGKALSLALSSIQAGSFGLPALVFDATLLGAPAEGGKGTVTRLWNSGNYEILADGAEPTAGFNGVSVRASQLNATGAARLEIGGLLTSSYASSSGSLQNANVINFTTNGSANIVLRSGALLQAADVFLMTGNTSGAITLEQGAGINTLGRGVSSYDASQGYIFTPGRHSVLALSNGQLDLLPPTAPDGNDPSGGAGAIEIGVCAAGVACAGDTRLYSEGSIATATDNRFVLGDAVRYGTRNLSLSLGGINAGSGAALAAAAARGVLPAGMTLNQDLLDRLLLGDTSTGAPALEALSLTVRDSVNFFGDVALSTFDASGKSALRSLVLGTPAIYGHGDADAVARIHTDTLIWTGARTAPGGVIADGPGTGSGQLMIDAREIIFGYGPRTQADTLYEQERVALGFAGVQLNASERVSATHKGSLSVYAAQGAWSSTAKAYDYSGGDLSITTPLLTGAAGSVNRFIAGGDIRVSGAAATPAASNTALASALGAEIGLDSRGGNLVLDTAVLLPSGKLSLAAHGDVTLADGAQLDLAGRRIDFFDVSKFSWGGDVVLDSRSGSVRQAAASRIDLSAQHNRAGKLAVFAEQGAADLAGQILGGSSGHYDAGGTEVPFSAGRIELHSQTLADFAGLNTRLTAGGVTGGRSFQLGQGDLVIGNEIQAHEVVVSLDNGHLTVNGTINASGEQAGSIRLSARNGVLLAGTSVLDASASVLRKDSYGQVIAAPNRAVIEVDAGQGTLAIASGARLDLRVAGDGHYGTVALNAPRLGGNDVAIDAAGSVTIQGAKSVQVNAFITDKAAAPGAETTTDGKSYQVIDQGYLDRLHEASNTFLDAALGNTDLMDRRLAGLRAYRDQFHLRPGVEIVADTAINPDGNLHVDGDIDLSYHRYASVNPHTQKTGVHGSGEAGALVIRAQGDLEVFGSISDGFDGSRLHSGFDSQGWYLTAGRQLFGADVVVPHGSLVALAAGTVFNAGKVLNYALPIAAMQMAAFTQLPAMATLAQPLALARGTVLNAAVFDAGGALLYAAGTVLAEAVTLPVNAQLSAGLRLPVAVSLAAMTWPAGVPLPHAPVGNGVVLASDIALDKGAFIPSDTEVKLPGGVLTVDLRAKDAEGNQGRIWALAPMLAGGSQSWDLTLVAGADTAAADRLSVLRNASGSLRLSDMHYGTGGAVREVPGTGSPATFKWGDLGLFEQMVMDFFGEYLLSFRPDAGSSVTSAQSDELMALGFIWIDPSNLNEQGYGQLADVDVPATPPDSTFVIEPGREQLPSVLRTGTGDLRLVSARDIATTSLFGVYTAGTPSASLAAPGSADRHNLPRSQENGTVLGALGSPMESLVDGGSQSLYAAWYPEAGGNLLLRAGGDVSGDSLGRSSRQLREEALGIATPTLAPSASVGNWLWRQGTGSVQTGADGVPTAWWINFGSYVAPPKLDNYYDNFVALPRLVGFTGFGTLGGGNLVLETGGNAGMLQSRGDHGSMYVGRSTGLNLAVASTGRIAADGSLVLTGGGDLDIRLGGGLNADPAHNAFTGSNIAPVANAFPELTAQRMELNGSITSLRGALRLEAGAVGTVQLRYGGQDPKDSRPNDVFSAGSANSAGGPVLVLGDSAVRLDSRGDLVLGSVADAGRILQVHSGTPFTASGGSYAGGGYSWFSLWTPSTAIDLLSAGGNLTPTLSPVDPVEGNDAQATDGNAVYPSVLRAAAASGSVYYGNRSGALRGVVLAPSPVGEQFAVAGAGQLELLAAGSLYAAGANFSTSGADPTALPSPFNPGFVGFGSEIWYGRQMLHNVSADAIAPGVLFTMAGSSSGQSSNDGGYPLFSFTPPVASGHVYTGQQPSRYYAVEGDLVGLRLGSEVYVGSITGPTGAITTWHDGGGAVAIRAGRDIVNAGTPLGSYDSPSIYTGYRSGSVGWYGQVNRNDALAPQRPTAQSSSTARGNLIVHTSADDVSVVQAGRDIRYSTFYIAGPGLLDLSAGRDVYMADKGELRSLGPVAGATVGDRNSGAAIAVAAGLGARGADWAAFAARYLDPANQADLGAGVRLADQPGKVVRVYGGSLTRTQWLAREFGYGGDESGAEAFMATQQAALNQARTSGISRDLAREFNAESQLHLVNWLTGRFGGANGRGLHFDAATTDARSFFAALPAEQQSAYLRNVYYAELKAAGREYNTEGGPRQGSYLRGREAIATLLPGKDYQGDLTMFSSALYYDQFVTENAPDRRPKPNLNYVREDEWIAMGKPSYGVPFYKVNDAGIHTDFGGDISLMVPGGRTLVGVDGGFMPGAGSGVLTQGAGDINVYSLGSLLLGQSRIFTTFGGNILAWSAEGDINAGRGSKTTVVYTPSRRVYDEVGNVLLSPNTPNTGAGIATLNPIPEIPPGDVDLIAPLGTIDAGEAGIRVSGNVNLAAMQVVNAENIQVQGEAMGMPVVAAVNIGALTNASAAASQAAVAAQDVMQRERAAARQNLPSVFTVRVLGFGNEPMEDAPAGQQPGRAQPAAYNPQGVVQVLGAGALSNGEMQALTSNERRALMR